MADKVHIEALLREKAGYESQIEAFQAELATEAISGNEDAKRFRERLIEDRKGYIKDVEKALKAAGHKAAAPAKRAETRPAKAEER